VDGLHRTHVLFVCLGNSCRSPMAEAIAAHIASDILEVASAGLAPLGHVQSMTKRTLAKNGYPADGLDSKPILEGDLGSADIIVNMTGRPALVVFQDASKVEDWAVEDPYGRDAETYQRVFEDIERRVVLLVSKMRMTGSSGYAVGYIQDEGTDQR
jgi:arsenate reductase